MSRILQLSGFHHWGCIPGSTALVTSITKRYYSIGPKCVHHPPQRPVPRSHRRMVLVPLRRAESSTAGPQNIGTNDVNHKDPQIPLRKVVFDLKGDLVVVHAKPIGQRFEFPPFWLRDNCQCPECIHPDTRQRMVDTFSIPENVKAQKFIHDSKTVTINWSDGHAGVYPYSWLSAHQLGQRVNVRQKQLSFREFESIKADYESLPTVLYENVMEKEESVLEWLEQIRKWGFCLVKGVPVEPESTQALLEKIAFIRHTHYGGFWDFTSDLTFKDTAYTSEALRAHTDNTYFTDPARLQLFHLLSHTHGEGGATLLVDGFKAAQLMQEENGRHCGTLAAIPQPFHSSGNEHVCIQPHKPTPVLSRRRASGMLYQIRWNNYDRAAKVDLEMSGQMEWYRAARHWNEIIRRPEMEIWLQLEPGTALIFDNWRMLHGRSEFTGKRRMCGGYINNDDFVSRYRLLKLGRQNALDHLGTYPDPIEI